MVCGQVIIKWWLKHWNQWLRAPSLWIVTFFWNKKLTESRSRCSKCWLHDSFVRNPKREWNWHLRELASRQPFFSRKSPHEAGMRTLYSQLCHWSLCFTNLASHFPDLFCFLLEKSLKLAFQMSTSYQLINLILVGKQWHFVLFFSEEKKKLPNFCFVSVLALFLPVLIRIGEQERSSS